MAATKVMAATKAGCAVEDGTAMTAHLAADPALARALAVGPRRTVLDPSAWDRAVEIERAGQLWSFARKPKES